MYHVCKYCYAEKFAKKIGWKNMVVADFDKLLGWLKALRVSDIVLIGGEPTLHPQFEDFLAVIGKYKIRCRVFTNGLSDVKAFRLLCENRYVDEIFFHYDDNCLKYGKYNGIRFFENLKYCVIQGKHVFLRYNISETNFDYKTVLKASKQYKAPIGYSISAPSYGNRCYIPIDEIKEYVSQLRNFVLSAKKEKVKLLLGRPLPLCVFPEKETLFWQKYAGLKATCKPINDLTFNPDMTTQLCSVLFNTREKKPLMSKDDLLLTIERLKKTGKKLMETPSKEECTHCKYFPELCQGGCLSYKVYAK